MTQPPRLPPLPVLEWKPDGTPMATAMEDVYFSKHDGLEESRAVFLAGCDLPDRWKGRAQFTVAELGFGTGLNLLALWQMWKAHRPSRDAKLDFVSFEGFPLPREDAARALARWPELAEFAATLLARWPMRARGVQHIKLADGVSLTLHIDDVAQALPNSQFQADAWFLDGFSPAKNDSMWAPDLYPQIMARSAPGAWVGTYTVAGAVRRGLADAGFAVSKEKGFAAKRNRLQAIAPETPQAPIMVDAYALHAGRVPPKSVAIIGAGIAGASAAHAFLARGAKVTVFDTAPAPASGASGNRLALLMPRLDAGDTGPARVLIASYLAARALYAGLPGASPVTVNQRAKNTADTARFEKLLADLPLPPDLLGAHSDGGLAHHGALILEPAKLIPALLEGASFVLGSPVEIELANRAINGASFDGIILANGMGIDRFAQTRWLPLAARLGQVEMGIADRSETSAIAAGHYALALENIRLWGATFQRTDTHTPSAPTSTARTTNNTALATLTPADWGPNTAQDAGLTSRTGLRATTPDKLPFAGRAPNYERILQDFASLRHGKAPPITPPTHEGLWLLGGLGARGFTFAPWLGEHLAAQAFGTASTLGRQEAELVSPLRFLFRALKRGAL